MRPACKHVLSNSEYRFLDIKLFSVAYWRLIGVWEVQKGADECGHNMHIPLITRDLGEKIEFIRTDTEAVSSDLNHQVVGSIPLRCKSLWWNGLGDTGCVAFWV